MSSNSRDYGLEGLSLLSTELFEEDIISKFGFNDPKIFKDFTYDKKVRESFVCAVLTASAENRIHSFIDSVPQGFWIKYPDMAEKADIEPTNPSVESSRGESKNQNDEIIYVERQRGGDCEPIYSPNMIRLNKIIYLWNNMVPVPNILEKVRQYEEECPGLTKFLNDDLEHKIKIHGRVFLGSKAFGYVLPSGRTLQDLENFHQGVSEMLVEH